MDAVLLEGLIVAPLTSSLIRADSTETVVAGGPKVLVSPAALEIRNWELGASGLDAGHPKIVC